MEVGLIGTANAELTSVWIISPVLDRDASTHLQVPKDHPATLCQFVGPKVKRRTSSNRPRMDRLKQC
ncbi:uncharacterized protein ARMOST_01541 [Armillaria ostoyae]|uniref:Uncharacterized protein n=1 Tax=Armillaria ostoyae TaxID=47428 RepID=A0A284QPA2_ARMOS|nr:uncharacterized protein ARMOST_01541 [Armillaria ostoyae]